ncbi:hypothetical protein COU49_02685 [Candidatus Nomurabacteria bacterium CG10_big_fil_rev_8_21_14_0_10_35_16]|uniref:Peptidase M24 domain-containing protein n=1 Tax=Candidatus Nomurabacteria bacterium CG10_big_fil_rev_8_21_14_0_10_35_16 TaxID=1974731 RepID=A0A2H0TAL0_9BACT|nr:MAG: hypothetical protein COU49_02685 [Candidatus Nomurabacteria bacterium CG10_big_fil_rev_8_21_14_0_10_35_16]
MSELLKNRVLISKTLRTKTANTIAKILSDNKNISEIQFRDLLKSKLLNNKNVHREGYYNPPPFGIATLFGSEKNFSRLSFGTLRDKEKWPKDNNIFKKEGGIGTIYVSPVHLATGMVGDYGISIYNGKNKLIQKHFKNCVEILKKIAEFAEVGMEFRELYSYYNKLLKKYNTKKTYIILQKHNKKVGDNLGHTIPWSYEKPTKKEQEIISGKDFGKIKDLICSKRIFLNFTAKFKIPPTIAFTIEFRSESKKPPILPNTSFHIMVLFINGKKTILQNFDNVFKATGMDYMNIK